MSSKYLTALIINIILLLSSVYYGMVVNRLSSLYGEFNAELPLLTQLQIKFWWVPIIFFSGTTVWSALKYKDSKK